MKTDTTLVLFPAVPAELWQILQGGVMSEVETTGVILAVAMVLMIVWARYKLT